MEIMNGVLKEDHILLDSQVLSNESIPDKILISPEEGGTIMLIWNKREKDLNNLDYFFQICPPHMYLGTGSTHYFKCFKGNKLFFGEKTLSMKGKGYIDAHREEYSVSLLWDNLKEVNQIAREFKRYKEYINKNSFIKLNDETGIVNAENVPELYSRVSSTNNGLRVEFGIYGGYTNNIKYYVADIITKAPHYYLRFCPVVKAETEEIALKMAKEQCDGDGDINDMSVHHLTEDYYKVAYWVFD